MIFWSFHVFFHLGQQYFFKYNIVIFLGFMCLLKEKHITFSWNLGKFSQAEKQCSVKSDESRFSVTFMRFLEKQWYMLWLTGTFFISEGFEDFSQPEAITDSPFNLCKCENMSWDAKMGEFQIVLRNCSNPLMMQLLQKD